MRAPPFMAVASGLMRSPLSPALSYPRGSGLQALRKGRLASPLTCSATGIADVGDATASVDVGNAENSGNKVVSTTLLVASEQDAAGQAIAAALLGRGGWLETTPGMERDGTRNGRAFEHKLSPTFLWLVEGGLLDLDDADRRWASAAALRLADDQQEQEEQPRESGRSALPSDVIFLSKHVAKSGVPALCVHPIGVPNGKYTEAKPLHARSQAILKKVLGPEHTDLAVILHNRARLLKSQGKYDMLRPSRCLSDHGPYEMRCLVESILKWPDGSRIGQRERWQCYETRHGHRGRKRDGLELQDANALPSASTNRRGHRSRSTPFSLTRKPRSNASSRVDARVRWQNGQGGYHTSPPPLRFHFWSRYTNPIPPQPRRQPLSSKAAGGKPGRCPPPSPRLAACLRELGRATREAGLDSVFDVTLEVTHHGPWLETPSMFVEIGSSEEHWGRADAAEVWATVLTRMLGLDGSSAGDANWADLDPAARAERAAFVCLGGGHYAPKPGDLARREGKYIGHMLASYVLDFGENGEGGWRKAVTEAVRSTRVGFPGAGGGVTAGVAALVDKKAFRSRDRAALLEHLGELGVEHRFKSSEC